ncbi:hypothetical protein [Paenibacillus wynnii]|uniref:hypothetical protein n=1 Tax=Paenibacillus wynnii TaxID=268407 RepID=UPI002793B61E|nr:hypothetical protein [Paenibacillus wynnii]MDQ0195856.1 hypothetical protein [Paenibacillus wynnii]
MTVQHFELEGIKIVILRFVKNVFLFLLGLAFLVKLSSYVVEPLYSKNTMNPATVVIAERLQAEMPVPPTQAFLKSFTKSLADEDIIADYDKFLEPMYNVSGKAKYNGFTQYHDVDILVYSHDYIESQEFPAEEER